MYEDLMRQFCGTVNFTTSMEIRLPSSILLNGKTGSLFYYRPSLWIEG